MLLSSPLFKHEDPIPKKFTCDGGNVNPELVIQHVPDDARSLVLIVDDPDAPGGVFTHWLLWNIDPQTDIIKQESKPPGSTEGRNDGGRTGFMGPCPPPGKPHRYFFRLYALDAKLEIGEEAIRAELEQEIDGHLIDKAELFGTYER